MSSEGILSRECFLADVTFKRFDVEMDPAVSLKIVTSVEAHLALLALKLSIHLVLFISGERIRRYSRHERRLLERPLVGIGGGVSSGGQKKVGSCCPKWDPAGGTMIMFCIGRRCFVRRRR